MRWKAWAGVIVVAAMAVSGAARAGDNPLLGTWTAVDPETGRSEILIIKPDTLQFGEDEPDLPYSFEQDGDAVSVDVANGQGPRLDFTLLGVDKAQLTIPGGPPIELTRMASAQAPAAEVAPSEANSPAMPPISGLMEALLPHAVETRYEPVTESLETLLNSGWSIAQASGAQGGFSLLLAKGSANLVCFLVPENFGEGDTALGDCRKLN